MCNNTPDFDHHKIMFAKIYAFAIILFVLLVTVNANAIEERQGVSHLDRSIVQNQSYLFEHRRRQHSKLSYIW